MTEIPDAISGRWLPQPKLCHQKYPNQHIQLYKGFSEMIQGEKVIEGRGVVSIVWYPSPHINFQFTYFTSERINFDDDVELKLTEQRQGTRLKVHCSSSKHWCGDNKTVISGYLCEPLTFGDSNNLSSLVFHIPNFWFFNISNLYSWNDDEDSEPEVLEGWLDFDGQFVFQYGNWRIVLATLDSCFELEELLETQGGNALTHVCKLEQVDKSTFTLNQARDQIKAFIYYLSFARGLWVAPILLTGFDARGNQIFEEWSNPEIKVDSWQDSYSWATPDSTDLVATFPGFMRHWQDETWKETIQISIHWYIESTKQSGGIGAAIVLQQVALERLAWVLLVKEQGSLQQDGFGRLTAIDQIRLLLSQLSIKTEIPSGAINLNQVAKELNWADGVQAIVEVRNSVIHPKVKKRKSITHSCQI